MRDERRRTKRHPIGAVVEVTDQKSGERMTSTTGDIGLFGCFVIAATPFLEGATITLKMTYKGRSCTAPGSVTHAQPGKGMGIAYGALAPNDYAVLQEWLRQESD